MQASSIACANSSIPWFEPLDHLPDLPCDRQLDGVLRKQLANVEELDLPFFQFHMEGRLLAREFHEAANPDTEDLGNVLAQQRPGGRRVRLALFLDPGASGATCAPGCAPLPVVGSGVGAPARTVAGVHPRTSPDAFAMAAESSPRASAASARIADGGE